MGRLHCFSQGTNLPTDNIYQVATKTSPIGIQARVVQCDKNHKANFTMKKLQ